MTAAPVAYSLFRWGTIFFGAVLATTGALFLGIVAAIDVSAQARIDRPPNRDEPPPAARDRVPGRDAEHRMGVLRPAVLHRVAAHLPDEGRAAGWKSHLAVEAGEWWFYESHAWMATLHRLALGSGTAQRALPGVILSAPVFSPDRRLMAVRRAEWSTWSEIPPERAATALEIWELPAMHRRQSLPDPENFAEAMAISPHNRVLVVAHGDGYSVWRIVDGKRIAELAAPVTVGPGNAIVFSPDGRTMLTHSHGNLRVWSTATWELKAVLIAPPTGRADPDAARRAEMRGWEVASVGFAAGGREIVAVTGDRYGWRWSLANANDDDDDGGGVVGGSQRRGPPIRLDRADDEVAGTAISRDGTLGAFITTHGWLRVWNMAEPSPPLFDQLVGTHGSSVTLDADNQHLAVVADDQLYLLQLPKPPTTIAAATSAVIPFDLPVPGVFGVTVYGSRVVTATLETQTGERIAEQIGVGRVVSLRAALSRGQVNLRIFVDAETVVTVGVGRVDPTVIAWRDPAGAERPISAVAVTPDGRYAAASVGRAVQVWVSPSVDGDAAQLLMTLPHAAPTALAFSPLEPRLAIGSTVMEVSFWNVLRPADSRTVAVGVPIRSVAFLPDGDAVAAGDGELIHLRAPLWRIGERVTVPISPVHRMQICPAGKSAAVVGGRKLAIVALGEGNWTVTHSIDDAAPRDVMCLVLGTETAILGGDGFCTAYDLATGRHLGPFGPDGLTVSVGAQSFDGRFVLLGYAPMFRPPTPVRTTMTAFRLRDGARLPGHLEAGNTAVTALSPTAPATGFVAGTTSGSLEQWALAPR